MTGLFATAMFRGIVVAQGEVAAAAIAFVQVIGGVAVAGEIVQVARRSYSRRRQFARSFSHETGSRSFGRSMSMPHSALPILDIPQTSIVEAPVETRTEPNNRWQWKVEVEDRRQKMKILEDENEQWKKDVEKMSGNMDALVDTVVKRHVERMEQEMQRTKQS